jgi:sulfur carrier protein ThiS
MKVLYINCLGGGLADHIDVAPGTTVAQLFEQRVQGRPEDFLIRVNRLPTSRDEVLQEGDRISFTPVRIEGAGRQQTVPL